ncbi:maleylpyruvate isomerase family mycothiol-dependent enzyme [Sphaerisporangium corydalis]|uniref:Maleylpyruvate isomerase family mycothiol-dependent enzyme n=1 Tax=Sphaerisporangium corydalis TaxID=1441875 RepID=A0ABV9E6D4_9ACTN|nr:maleylpyruvate isomerase family mycothiol-dependent enzyme [Sphaerisporangium corydalis]
MTKPDRAAAVFDDLAAECDQLDAILAALEPDVWERLSAASGWTIADVVLHLAQTDEAVVASVAGDMSSPTGASVDTVMDDLVAGERGAPGDKVLERWRTSYKAALGALRGCPPGERLQWVASTLSAPALATTRIAEHWAHALDITEPLGLGYPDTDRLRHVAWLGHRTLPYAFAVAGEQGGPVRCELTGPSGEVWRFGDADAPSVITGTAGEFCRVGAQRLAAKDSSLTTEGPYGAAALRVLRNYAA